jgi:hypothetical protein
VSPGCHISFFGSHDNRWVIEDWLDAYFVPRVGDLVVLKCRDYRVLEIKWKAPLSLSLIVEDIELMRQREADRVDADEARSRGLG